MCGLKGFSIFQTPSASEIRTRFPPRGKKSLMDPDSKRMHYCCVRYSPFRPPQQTATLALLNGAKFAKLCCKTVTYIDVVNVFVLFLGNVSN